MRRASCVTFTGGVHFMEEKRTAGKGSNGLEYLERQLHNLSRLVEINSIINSTLDMARLLTIIMENIKGIMDTEASTLLLYEEESRDLVFKVALSEVGKELQERYRVRIGQGVAGWVAEHRKTVYINDVYADERFDPNFDLETGFKTKAILCAPLLFKGKLVGVIQAINPLNRPAFDEEDVRLFNAFAAQCVLAVQNAIFFQNALEEERIKNEISSARAIQQSLLPSVSSRTGELAIAARSLSAREVGGEFYDIFHRGDSVGIVIGDLHMKGIPGALCASMASGAVKALSRMSSGSPASLLRMVDKAVSDQLPEGGSLSIFYGVVDGSGKTLCFANAGIAYPILVRGGVARYLRFSGDFSGRAPKNVTVSMEPGDLFVILTDGLVNLKNRGAQLLGLKRVMKRLERGYKGPDEAVAALLKLMDEFTEGLERREDVSLIALKLS